MSSISQSFREWLGNDIRNILSKKISQPPFLIWCDPHGEWIDLLKDASEMIDLELRIIRQTAPAALPSTQILQALPVESETTQRIASYRSNYLQRNPFRRNLCNWKQADKMDRKRCTKTIADPKGAF
jgi:hypothetical protein